MKNGPSACRPVRPQYDEVGSHGWYKNLELTISHVLATLEHGHLLIDYSSASTLPPASGYQLFNVSPVTVVPAVSLIVWRIPLARSGG